MRTRVCLGALLITSTVMLLSACGGAPLAPIDASREALQYVPDPEFAKVYVYRSMPMRESWALPLALDRKKVGKLQGRNFIVLRLAAGEHDLTASVGAPFYYSEGDGHHSVMSLHAEKGKLYFAEFSLKREGTVILPQLELVADDIGKRSVAQCKLVRMQEEATVAPKIFN